MIGQIHGFVTMVNNHEGTACILTQSGVGYTVYLGGNYTAGLLCGQEINILIETIVKEDSITLYGFNDYEKQIWFRSLLKVSGVGAKMAINIIDSFSIVDITSAIINQDSAFFQQMGGVGEKVSQRIVADLKKEPAKNTKILGSTRYKNADNMQNSSNMIKQDALQKKQNGKKNADNVQAKKINLQDVISALVNLGFDYNKSYSVAASVQEESVLEDAITIALRKIGTDKNY